MSINYDQLSEIKKTLQRFPNARLQIVTKNRDEKIVRELIRNGYYLLGSYLYNSQGRNSPGLLNLINITDNVLSPRNLMPSKNSYLFQISKPISPPVNTSLTIMYGAGINLLYLSPSISYDVTSRIDLSLIAQIFFLENNQKLENLMRGVYIQMKYSF